MGLSIKCCGYGLRWGRQVVNGLRCPPLDRLIFRSQSDIQVEAKVDDVCWNQGAVKSGAEPDVVGVQVECKFMMLHEIT